MRHFDFKYLLKADDDTFVCLARIASMLHDLPPEIGDRVYAGVPTACNHPDNPDYWVRFLAGAQSSERGKVRWCWLCCCYNCTCLLMMCVYCPPSRMSQAHYVLFFLFFFLCHYLYCPVYTFPHVRQNLF